MLLLCSYNAAKFSFKKTKLFYLAQFPNDLYSFLIYGNYILSWEHCFKLLVLYFHIVSNTIHTKFRSFHQPELVERNPFLVPIFKLDSYQG